MCVRSQFELAIAHTTVLQIGETVVGNFELRKIFESRVAERTRMRAP